jgi:palmitoyltransferase
MAAWHTQLSTPPTEERPQCLETLETATDQTVEDTKAKLIQKCLEDLAVGNFASIVEALVKGQVDVNLQDANGICALHAAVYRDEHSVVNVLLDEACCPIDQRTSTGMTPLMFAVVKGNLALIKLLLDKGADIEAKSNILLTPCLFAAQYGQLTAFLVLRHRGADTAVIDKFGQSAVHWAAYRNFPEFLRMLMAFHHPLGSQNSSGYTPLHRASMTNAVDTLSCLLRAGCDASVKSSSGKTPLELAQELQLNAAQRVFQAHSKESSSFSWYFRYLFYIGWLVIYITYGLEILPYSAECLYSSLAFNLCMLLLPVSAALTLCSTPGHHARQADSLETGLLASIGEAFEAGRFNEIPAGRQICFTCFIKRPQRSKHCRVCDGCVPRQDHHCHFIGKCIGEGNHRSFLLTLMLLYFSTTLFVYLELQLLTSHLHYSTLPSYLALTALKVLESSTGNVLVTALVMAVAWYSGCYLCLELYAISSGLTANEVFNGHRYRYLLSRVVDPTKGQVVRFVNPFTKGILKNWMSFLAVDK